MLPPTCRGASRNDSCIMHPLPLGMVRDMHVNTDDKFFDSHDPPIITFSFPLQLPVMHKWVQPANLCDLGIVTEHLQEPFAKQRLLVKQKCDTIDDSASGLHALQTWPHACEQAMARAVLTQHTLDPIRNPSKNVPKAYLGRCMFPAKPVFHQKHRTKEKIRWVAMIHLERFFPLRLMQRSSR